MLNEAATARPVGVAVATPFLPELESLRGIAIALVVLFHIDSRVTFFEPKETIRAVSPLFAFVRAGNTGVALFFILSAFLLSMPFLAQAAGGKHVSVQRYASRRALRILPLYYCAVLAAAILSASAPRDLLRGFPYLLFLNGFPGMTTPLPPYSNVWWSLATEAEFYVLLPLLPFAFGSRLRRAGGAIALAVICVLYLTFVARVWKARTIEGQLILLASVLGRAPMFLAGIACAWLYLRYGDALRRRLAASRALRSGGADLIFLAALAALGFLLQWAVLMGPRVSNAYYELWTVVQAGLWAAVLLLLLLAPLRCKPLLSNTWLNRLGVLSYSLYIVHLPIILPLFNTLSVRWDLAPGWNVYNGLLTALAIVICIAVSEVTYRCIERPFLVRKERVRA